MPDLFQNSILPPGNSKIHKGGMMANKYKGIFISRISQLQEYFEWEKLARKQTGKSFITQLREINALREYGGQCGISDYYWYKLYDDDYLTGNGARDFLGWRLQQQFSLALNPRDAVLPAWNKCVFTQLCCSAGLPVAPILACFHPAEKISGDLGVHLRSKEATAKFLRNPSIYPLFGKPAYSQQGYGSAYLDSYDHANDCLKLFDGTTISIEVFLKRLEHTVDARYHKPEHGYVFQQTFRPAPEIQAITNWKAICGVRVVCLNGPNGVKPIRAVWKIAVPPNHVDNFSLGKYGNLLADVDLTTGKISKTLNGFWPKAQILSSHPFSGEYLDGFTLPGWDKIIEACHHAGTVFPLMKIHHWDFALTDQGPLILELNDIGATEMLQIHGHGLLTPETREFLKSNADAKKHPWIKAL